jgi:hypothetical protein
MEASATRMLVVLRSVVLMLRTKNSWLKRTRKLSGLGLQHRSSLWVKVKRFRPNGTIKIKRNIICQDKP